MVWAYMQASSEKEEEKNQILIEWRYHAATDIVSDIESLYDGQFFLINA